MEAAKGDVLHIQRKGTNVIKLPAKIQLQHVIGRRHIRLASGIRSRAS